jgi:hypothetical protein
LYLVIQRAFPGGNVQIVPFGTKAYDLFGESLLNMVKTGLLIFIGSNNFE